MISKRIAPGLYEVSANGRTFQVEDHFQARGDGTGRRNDWMLYEINAFGDREYCQDFCAKRDAMDAIIAIVNDA